MDTDPLDSSPALVPHLRQPVEEILITTLKRRSNGSLQISYQ